MTFRTLVIGLIAVSFLMTGCAAKPAPSVTQPAVTEAPSPTPTAESAQPKVPFDGDCAQVLTPASVADIFNGQEPTISAVTYLGGVMPDISGSLAQLGGLACNWWSADAEISHVSVSMVPVAAVPADLIAVHEQFGCYGWSICGRGEVASGMWVLVETPRLDENEEVLSDSETQRLTAVVDAAVGSVFGHSPADYTGVAVTPTADWWALPTCDELQPAVAAAAVMTSPEAGFPGDNVPEGAVWDSLQAADIVRWCPWYQHGDQDTRITELYLQAGVGAPSASQLTAAGAELITIPGADVAYRLVQDYSGGARSVEILAVVGPNRLLVGGDEQEAVAAAVLAALAP